MVDMRYNSQIRVPQVLRVGMWVIERQAAQQAIERERRYYLPILEAWAKENDRKLAPDERRRLNQEIQRLRRCLKMPPPDPSPEAIDRQRQLTRDRVRRYRQRQLQATE